MNKTRIEHINNKIWARHPKDKEILCSTEGLVKKGSITLKPYLDKDQRLRVFYKIGWSEPKFPYLSQLILESFGYEVKPNSLALNEKYDFTLDNLIYLNRK